MRQAQVRSGMILGLLLLVAMIGRGSAEPGFDEKYQRDFNLFNPINQYQSTNPLNPINAYDPANPFNPINRFDPGNPANPIKQLNFNNRFNLLNRYRPENPLNPSSTPRCRSHRWMVGAGWGRGAERHSYTRAVRFTRDKRMSP